MTGRCPRLFEVEAARDGRVGGREKDMLLLHVRTCPDCRAEVHSLESLSASLRALPVGPTDALTVRRQRHRLLGALNDLQVAPRRPRIWIGAAIVAASLGATVAFVSIHSTWAPLEVAPVTGDPVTVSASGRWSRVDDGTTTRVRLDDGSLDIHVEHRGASHGLVVLVPDGQVDDLGTTFHVEVRDGRTVAVSVRDGAVVLRLGDRSPVLIAAGGSWMVDAPPIATAAPAPSIAEPHASASEPRPAAPAPIFGHAKGEVETSVAAREFRDAVTALNASGAAGADAFRSFLARHPNDPRAEDAAYLLVLALSRSGDAAAARAAARGYLTRYPNGFRRADVERLAR